MTAELQIAGLCGSLRAKSYNHAILAATRRLMPAGMALRVCDFTEVPIYRADEDVQGWPAAVATLGDAIRHADGVIIASPEYNFTIPGGLKNLIDWLSRLPAQPFKSKPVVIMGASAGPVGTARMQYDLRKTLHFLEAHVLLKPEIFIGNVRTKVDQDGELTDETTRKLIADQMLAFSSWIRRVKQLTLPENEDAQSA